MVLNRTAAALRMTIALFPECFVLNAVPTEVNLVVPSGVFSSIISKLARAELLKHRPRDRTARPDDLPIQLTQCNPEKSPSPSLTR
jgi:hypothetical protein